MPDYLKKEETPKERGQRLAAFAEHTRAPDWLRQAVRKIAAEAATIPPIEDDRASLPEFIYRH